MGLPSEEKYLFLKKKKKLIDIYSFRIKGDRFIVLEAVSVFSNCSGFVYSWPRRMDPQVKDHRIHCFFSMTWRCGKDVNLDHGKQKWVILSNKNINIEKNVHL